MDRALLRTFNDVEILTLIAEEVELLENLLLVCSVRGMLRDARLDLREIPLSNGEVFRSARLSVTAEPRTLP